jgi:hypothetical protein
MRATDKPFNNIDEKNVYEAYKAVKSKAGAARVYGQTIEQFEVDLKINLYKIWNRMSSGSYFPPPVRAVAIPKTTGGERILGLPTVADRVAQMVVEQVIEPNPDPVFLEDAYAYRPAKSALDAVGVTRKRWEALRGAARHGRGSVGEWEQRGFGVGDVAGTAVQSATDREPLAGDRCEAVSSDGADRPRGPAAAALEI